MTWRLVSGLIGVLIMGLCLVGWLVTEGDESRTYGWVGLVTGVATYWLVPWTQFQGIWE